LKTIAEKAFELTSLFEAEVLVQLMLWKWNHPFANDGEFANALLEDAAAALREAVDGKQLLEDLAPSDVNFIAAVWYAERIAVETPGADPSTIDARNAWLSALRHALPSCFCDPRDLDQP